MAEQTLSMTSEWDKTFPASDRVEHGKTEFRTRYGFMLAADVYVPRDRSRAGEDGTLPAIALCGPFGAVKEQCAGLYAQTLAERGFLTIAFDPSFTGESSGEPRYMASPDINTEDFQAAVDYLSCREDVDAEDSEEARHAKRVALNAQRLADYEAGTYALGGGVVDPLPEDAPFYVRHYFDYYKTPRGYHERSLNSNGGWNVIGCMSFMNQPILRYSNEIRSAALVMHGDAAHSFYFGKEAFEHLMEGNPVPENKELLVIPGATHTDLYDGGEKGAIPWDKLEGFFAQYLA